MPRISENPLAVRTLHQDESGRLDRLYSDLPKSLDECKTCHGTGRFLWWDDQEAADRKPVEWECDCIEQFKLFKFLLNSGIDLHHQRLSWADAVAVPEATRELVDEYRDHADNYLDAGMGLILYGPPGTGKTLVSTLLTKGLLALGHDAFFSTWDGIIDLFAAGWTSAEDKAWFERRIVNAGVLVMDDLGRHRAKAEMAESLLDRVIRARVNGARPTLITTNLDAEGDDVSTLYSHNVLSLISEVSIAHRVGGIDYRRDFSQAKREEVREGLTRPLVLH
jgi:DNA replication protein DnaC